MKQEPFIHEYHRQLTAAKIAKTKTDNTIGEIKKAIDELHQENVKPTQANVIRRLKGKRCKKTIISHWKILHPKQSSPETNFVERDHAQQKPLHQLPNLHQLSNFELGLPSLEQEIKNNPGRSPNLLLYYLQVMRENRIHELRRIM